MAESTGDNPYQKLLGLSAELQQPNHYELLELTLFEEDPQAIRDAAADQNSKLLRWQSGKSYQQAERLMSEIGEARDVLLDVESKQEYDLQLRKQLNLPETQTPPQTELEEEIIPLKPLEEETTEAAKSSNAANTYGLASNDGRSSQPPVASNPTPKPIPPSRPAQPASPPTTTFSGALDYTRLGLPADLTDPNFYELLSLKSFEPSSAKINTQILRELGRIVALVRDAPEQDRPMLQALQMKLVEAATTLADEKARERYDARLRGGRSLSGSRRLATTDRKSDHASTEKIDTPPRIREPQPNLETAPLGKPLWSQTEMRDAAKHLAHRYGINVNQRHASFEVDVKNQHTQIILERFEKEVPKVESVYHPNGGIDEGGKSSLTIGAFWGTLAGAITLILGAWITVWAPLMLVDQRTSSGESAPACCRVVAFAFALAGGVTVAVAAGMLCAELTHQFGRMASCRDRDLAGQFAMVSGLSAFGIVYFLPTQFDWARGLMQLHWLFQIGFLYIVVSSAKTHVHQLIEQAKFCEQCHRYMEPRPIRNLRFGALQTICRAFREGNLEAGLGAFCLPAGEAGNTNFMVCPSCQSGVLEVTLNDSVKFQEGDQERSLKLQWLAVSRRTTPDETASVQEADKSPVKAKSKKSQRSRVGSNNDLDSRPTPRGRYAHLLPPDINCIHCGAGMAWIKPLSRADRYVCRKCGRSFDYS